MKRTARALRALAEFFDVAPFVFSVAALAYMLIRHVGDPNLTPLADMLAPSVHIAIAAILVSYTLDLVATTAEWAARRRAAGRSAA